MALEKVDLDMRLQDKPKLVVYMITYNHEPYIEQAITSVMTQKTDFKFKLYIGEDCSTDKTRAICKTLKNKYPDKIELYLNAANLGSQKNALQMYSLTYESGAEYIAMLEGDDYWTDPLKLQQQVDFLDTNPEYSLSFTRFKVKKDQSLDLEDDKYGPYFTNEKFIVFDFDKFTKGWYGGIPTLVFRASSFGLDLISKYQYFRDIHLFTELLKVGKGVCLSFYSAVYRIHEGGIHSSATLIERAKIASLCYEELYFNNREIPQLKIKYRYFHRSYIKELLLLKHYFKAFEQSFLFGLYMRDLNFVISNWKRILKKILSIRKVWIFKKLKNKISRKHPKKKFLSSQQYWEQRYRSNKNSGSGSYGRLADFKADVLNSFVKAHSIQTVIEYGCGDGNQLSLADYPNYIGFDVSQKALGLCKERFKDDQSKSFHHMDDLNGKGAKAELVLSLDVLYHLVEDDVFDAYMELLFSSSTNYVIIYSSNYDEQAVAHVKNRVFTKWVGAHVSQEWELVKHIKNKYPFDKHNPDHTSMADFYIYKKIKP